MTDLICAQQLLNAHHYTCVLCKGEVVYTSTERGVAPLLAFLEKKIDLSGFSAADRVIGKGAALLYVLLDVCAVHAQVISDSAKTTLEQHGIPVTYDQVVPRIFNRTRTGFCPIESATWDIDDPAQALITIQTRLKGLS